MNDRRRKLIVNIFEETTEQQLRKVEDEYDCRVDAKVRVADALNIERSGLSNDEYKYALQAHFDFVVAQESDSRVLFAVEFDEPHHQKDPDAIRRDRLKNSICEKLGMPLLRIDAEFLQRKFRKFTVLEWFIHMWFEKQAFHEAQRSGLVPDDELFHQLSMVRSENGKVTFPYNPIENIINSLWEWKEKGALRTGAPDLFHRDDADTGYSLSLAIIYHKDGYILGTGRCRLSHFKVVPESDVSDDLATIDAYSNFERYLQGKYALRSATQVKEDFERRKFDNWRVKVSSDDTLSFTPVGW